MDAQKRGWRRLPFRKLFLIAILGMAALIFFLPTILLHTPLRTWVVGGVLAREGIALEIGDMRAGWLTPLRMRDTKMGPIDRPHLIAIDEIRSDRTLLSALSEGVEVGELVVRRPQIHIWIDENGSNLEFPAIQERLSDREDPTDAMQLTEPNPRLDAKDVAITIEDAELWLKTKTMPSEANVFREFDITGQLQQDAQRRILTIDPGRLLDRAPISTELCDGLLKYFVPILAEATWVNGEISLDLSECEIDLDQPEDSRLTGALHIHGVQAGVKNAMMAAASERIAQLLGGKGTDTIHLADDAVVSFALRDGAVWHDGAEFGLPRVSPDFVVRTSGSVSFQDELDLKIEVPIAAHFLHDHPLAEAIQSKTLILNATGTFQKPKVSLNDESLFADLISLIGDLGTERLESGRLLGGVLGGEGPRSEDFSGEAAQRPVRDLLLGVRDAILQRGTETEDDKNAEADSSQDTLDEQIGTDVGNNRTEKEIGTPILDRLQELRRSRGERPRRRLRRP